MVRAIHLCFEEQYILLSFLTPGRGGPGMPPPPMMMGRGAPGQP